MLVLPSEGVKVLNDRFCGAGSRSRCEARGLSSAGPAHARGRSVDVAALPRPSGLGHSSCRR